MGSRPGGNAWGDNELQTYTDQQTNARVDGGNLLIQARKDTHTGKNNLLRHHTSARIKIQCHATFTSGRMEARIKLPQGQGVWTAFWMLGTNITSVGWLN